MLSSITRSCSRTVRGVSSHLPYRTASSFTPEAWETLELVEQDKILHVKLNRPKVSNAMSKKMWYELARLYQTLPGTAVRAVVLSGNGKNFCSGLDLADHADLINPAGTGAADTARHGWYIRRKAGEYQAATMGAKRVPQPIIGVAHGACIGGAVDLLCGVDIRVAATDAVFQVKETEIGMAADVGTLQTLPRELSSPSVARELIYTGRSWSADEALRYGFVSRVAASKSEAIADALRMAGKIASLSPLAVQGSKVNVEYAARHGVDAGLDYNAVWSSSALQTQDLGKSVQGIMQGTAVEYAEVVNPEQQ